MGWGKNGEGRRVALVCAIGVLLHGIPATGFGGTGKKNEDPRLRAALAPFANIDDNPGCSVSVRENGRVIHRRGYGLADREARLPIEPRTRFRLASITKTLVTTTVASLAEERRDAGEPWLLDRPLTDLFGAFADATTGAITVRQLLAHTAGVPREFGTLVPPPNAIVDADVAEALRTLPKRLLFTPGTRFSYSNAGFAVLGALIERLRGLPLEAAVGERVFGPAGMERATMRHPEMLAGDPWLAVGYVRKENAWARAPRSSRTCGVLGKGGVHATTIDLDRFLTAIDRGRLLSPATWRELFRENVLDGKGVGYGLGWETDGVRQWHGGYWDGFYNLMYRRQTRGCRMSAVILCNDDGAGGVGKLMPVAQRIEKALCGDGPGPRRQSGSGASSTAE